jgi:hypothetical protein
MMLVPLDHDDNDDLTYVGRALIESHYSMYFIAVARNDLSIGSLLLGLVAASLTRTTI